MPLWSIQRRSLSPGKRAREACESWLSSSYQGSKWIPTKAWCSEVCTQRAPSYRGTRPNGIMLLLQSNCDNRVLLSFGQKAQIWQILNGVNGCRFDAAPHVFPESGVGFFPSCSVCKLSLANWVGLEHDVVPSVRPLHVVALSEAVARHYLRPHMIVVMADFSL